MKKFEESNITDARQQNARESESVLEHNLMRGGIRGVMSSWLLVWRERGHAVRTSRELLVLFRAISAQHPELVGIELYKLLVMVRNSCDAMTAEAVLECAEESFATWPVRRELTLCDVVHYLTVNEFLALHYGEQWMSSDIRHVITSRIPQDLCVH